MSVIAELSIFPLSESTSLSPYVARVVSVINDSGLDYQLGPMGTCIEGPWDKVMDVVDRCFQELATDCNRIYLTLKIDYQKDKDRRLQSKVHSVQDKLSS